MAPDELEGLISSARFATYIDLASGDREAATRLYIWTGELAGALFTDYRQLEVVFRNVVDQALTAYARSLDPAVVTWLDDSWLPRGANGWDKGAQDAIRTARQRARGRNPSHDGVIAGLTFGFWRYIVDGRYEEAFWLPALDAAFIGIPAAAAVDRRQKLEQVMINLNRFRNRLAHHEPICKPTTRQGPGGTQLVLSVDDVYKDLLKVLQWAKPDVSAQLLATSRVQQLLSNRPV